MAPGNQQDYLPVGRFGRPHGVKGALKLKSLSTKPDNLKGFKAFYLEGREKPLRIYFSKAIKGGYLVTVAGIKTPEQAASLKGREVFVKRAELKPPEPGEFYLADLVGLEVRSNQGKKLGLAENIYEFGAGPVLEIALDEPLRDYGKTLMIPFAGDFITDIDLKEGTLTIDFETWLADENEK